MQKLRKELFYFFTRPEIIIILIATFLRIVLANLTGIYFPSGGYYDDRLMVEYAVLPTHFGNPSVNSLVKTMSFPLFLDFVYLSGMTYATVLAIIWAAAAGLAACCFRQIYPGRWYALFVYLFVLYTPAAFDASIGTRLYRNAIIAPFVMICFLLMLYILLRTAANKNLTAGNVLCPAVFLGLFFLYTYYIKEDGIWMLPCLCLFLAVPVLISAVRFAKLPKAYPPRFIRLTAAFLSPIIIFWAGTQLYKTVNLCFFGVAETNTRTEGELKEFAANIYKIDSENRTAQIWAPCDAIQSAFDASPTLAGLPELEDNIMHSPWYGNDIVQHPINGDFLTWVIRTALLNSGLWQSEKQVQELFAQVNDELAAAFKSGQLQKDDAIQLLSSGGGRTPEEILGLKTPVLREYACAVFLHSYLPGANYESDYTDILSCEQATLLTHTNLLPLAATTLRVKESGAANRVILIIFKIYSILNPALFILAVIGLAVSLVRLLRRKRSGMADKEALLLLVSVFALAALFGIGCMYSFSIAWFAEFVWLQNEMQDSMLSFYNVGLVPLLSLFYLTGLSLLLRNLSSRFHSARRSGRLSG